MKQRREKDRPSGKARMEVKHGKIFSANKGLPKGIWAFQELLSARVNSKQIMGHYWEWGMAGFFRSDDGGKTWAEMNNNRELRQRAWYYSRIYADPTSEDIVYVVNVSYHKFERRGKNLHQQLRQTNGDSSWSLDWILTMLDRMIIGDDGGAQVSFWWRGQLVNLS